MKVLLICEIRFDDARPVCLGCSIWLQAGITMTGRRYTCPFGSPMELLPQSPLLKPCIILYGFPISMLIFQNGQVSCSACVPF
jgi:hypothetical protein